MYLLSILLGMLESNRFKNDYLLGKNGFYRATLRYLSVKNFLESARNKNDENKKFFHSFFKYDNEIIH